MGLPSVVFGQSGIAQSLSCWSFHLSWDWDLLINSRLHRVSGRCSYGARITDARPTACCQHPYGDDPFRKILLIAQLDRFPLPAIKAKDPVCLANRHPSLQVVQGTARRAAGLHVGPVKGGGQGCGLLEGKPAKAVKSPCPGSSSSKRWPWTIPTGRGAGVDPAAWSSSRKRLIASRSRHPSAPTDHACCERSS